MHSLAFILLSLAPLYLPIASSPLQTKPPNNKPVCTGLLPGSSTTMQQHCVDTLGATCALVVVFPEATESGNPDNCGNACDCSASSCPAVPPLCTDSDCLGIGPTPGISSQVSSYCFDGLPLLNCCNCTGLTPYALGIDGSTPDLSSNHGSPPR